MTANLSRVFPLRLIVPVLLLSLLTPGSAMAAVQINIGSNQVNTGTVSGCTQGSGNSKEETRSLPVFHGIEVDGAFQVTIAAGQKQAVRLGADDNLLPLILTEVHNGILKIAPRSPVCSSLPLTLDIGAETLDSIESSGANRLRVENLREKLLDIKLSGSSNMSLAGEALELASVLEGASELQAVDLIAKQVTVAIEGAGSAEVHASERLKASISGVGTIRYKGDPPQVERNIMGWGEIAPLTP